MKENTKFTIKALILQVIAVADPFVSRWLAQKQASSYTFYPQMIYLMIVLLCSGFLLGLMREKNVKTTAAAFLGVNIVFSVFMIKDGALPYFAVLLVGYYIIKLVEKIR